MPQQDIASEWKSFDDAKRTRLLGKMSPTQKKNLRSAIENAGPHSVADFTSNPKGEGLYRMTGPNGAGPVDANGVALDSHWRIPFSRVPDALKSGFKLHPDEEPGYKHDLAHQGAGPSLWDRSKEFFDNASEPIPDTPLEWNSGNRTVGSLVRSIPAALGNIEKQPINIVNRGARTLAGMPAGMLQTVKDIYAGRPEGIGSLDPSQIAEQEWKGYQRDVDELGPMAALSNVGGDAAAMYAAGKAGELPARGVRSLPELKRMAEDRFLASRFGPRNVEVGGIGIPMGVGEVNPGSVKGRLYTNLKRRGVKAPRFEEFEAQQQEAVKDVIRRTALPGTGGGFTRGHPLEPGAAMTNAAVAAFDAARPIYRKLDKSLIQVPAAFVDASKITKQAVVRAEKLGVPIDLEPRIVDRQGKPVYQLSPKQIKSGLAIGDLFEEFPDQQPLGTFMRVRSQLLKMQRSSADPATRYAIGQEIETLNRAMDASLKRTPKGKTLLKEWASADRLWSQGYARAEVADAVRDSTKGTPAAEQTPGLTPVPTKLQGAALVARLNDLAVDGTLDRAFTPAEVRNLRQSADILDRIQRTHVGTGEETVGHTRGLGRALVGAALPIAGAGVGLVVGGLSGLERGAVAGYLVQRYGEHVLVDVMTRTDGMRALEEINKARTPAARQTAMNKLTAVAAAASAEQKPKSLAELKAEAARLRPAASAQEMTH